MLVTMRLELLCQTSPARRAPVRALAFCLTIALAASVATPLHAVVPGDVAPPWTGVDLITQEQHSFPQVLNDKPAVLIFWATWCPYCKAFMPYVEKIQQDYAAAGVQIITFNTKERGRGDPQAYARNLDYPLLAIGAADAIGDAYDIAFIPGLLVVDGEGVIAYRRRSTNLPAGKTVSQQWDAEVRAVLDELTQQSQPADDLQNGLDLPSRSTGR